MYISYYIIVITILVFVLYMLFRLLFVKYFLYSLEIFVAIPFIFLGKMVSM